MLSGFSIQVLLSWEISPLWVVSQFCVIGSFPAILMTSIHKKSNSAVQCDFDRSLSVNSPGADTTVPSASLIETL